MSITKFPEDPISIAVTTTLISVNSTTQQLLFTGTADLVFVVISNQSVNRPLWIKPDDNTNTKQGILVPAGERLDFPIASELSIFGIMDQGGSVDISVVEFS